MVQIIVAVFLSASLALMPVASASAMGHVTAAPEMDMGALGDDCACCKTAVSHACPMVCCQHLTALPVEGWIAPAPRARFLVEREAAAFAPNLLRPDPPPPRS